MFVAITFDLEHETFIVYIVSLNFTLLDVDIHPSYRPQISSLIVKEAFKKVFAKYSDFAYIFSPDLASKLPEHTKINDYTIKLIKGQQLSYKSIYSLGPVELKPFKAYIETNLANKFIKLFKSPASTFHAI